MVGGSKELEITIGPDGTVHAEVNGVKGKSCVDLIKFLEEALGPAKRKNFKPDYYEREGYITGDVTARDNE